MDSFKEEKVPESSTDGNTGGRSYECSFCKRGFTNAQALGGHMNIHRKDKAKANKQVIKPPSSHFSNPSGFVQPNYHDYVAQNSRNQFYFQLPNPSHHDPPHVISHAVESNSVNLGVNLSLEMGPLGIENEVKKSINVMREERMEHEVDLELRLGHDP